MFELSSNNLLLMKAAMVFGAAVGIAWLRGQSRTFTQPSAVPKTWEELQLRSKMPQDEVLSMFHNSFKRPNDVVVVTYPKSGTHLVAFACWQLLQGGKELTMNMHEDVPFCDRTWNWNVQTKEVKAPLIGNSGKRLMFSHLPPAIVLNNAHKDARFIYVVRDVHDAVRSFHTMLLAMSEDHGGFRGTLDEFVEAFCKDEIMYGSWIHHVEAWTSLAEVDNRILIIRYEDILKDQATWLWKINTHIRGTMFKSEEDIETSRVLEYLSFKWMKDHYQLFQARTKAMYGDSKFQMINKGQSESSAQGDNDSLSPFARNLLKEYLETKCPKRIRERFLRDGRNWTT